jgi:hypothetical protein
MGNVIYALCALASIACAVLLFRGYRKAGGRLLLLSAACFSGLAVNNILAFTDFVIVPRQNLALARQAAAAGAVFLFLVGLILNDNERG